MEYEKYIPLLIIVLTAMSSYAGFTNQNFFDRHKFNVGAILGSSRQWDRLLTSGFLHADYMHLIFNMMTLYFFSDIVIAILGLWKYIMLYFMSIVGGGLLSLWTHRRNPYYNAIGASGGVVGVLFSSIIIAPQMGIYIFFIPIPVPAWIFGIVYLCFSIYGMQRQFGNIGHDAHLGGATVGLLITIAFVPFILLIQNLLYVGAIILPLIVLAYFVWKKK